MSVILTLHQAIRALLPAGIPHHEGQAPDNAEAPWLVSTFTVPDLDLTEGVTVTAATGELVVTIAAETEAAANHWAGVVDAALVGAFASPTPDYWVGALTPGRRVGPYPAGRTAADTNLRYQVVRQAYRFTYSTT